MVLVVFYLIIHNLRAVDIVFITYLSPSTMAPKAFPEAVLSVEDILPRHITDYHSES